MITTNAVRLMLLMLFFAGFLAIPQPVLSAVENGNKLYDWLLAAKRTKDKTRANTQEEVDDLTKASMGLGFVIAVDSAFRGITFCIPPSVENGQLLDIVHQYLETHPEERHLNGATLVSRAIAQKFPCRK